MQQLCAVIKEGQASQAILLFSLDSSFITPIRDFFKNTIRIFQNNYRLLLKVGGCLCVWHSSYVFLFACIAFLL